MNEINERRRFLTICAGTAILATAVPLGFYVIINKNNLRNFIHKILVKHLPGTIISTLDVETFTDDFFIERDDISMKINIFSLLEPVVRLASGFDENLHGKIYNFERSVITNFLLNSDFFNSESNRGTVTYFGAPDKICKISNPFSNFIKHSK